MHCKCFNDPGEDITMQVRDVMKPGLRNIAENAVICTAARTCSRACHQRLSGARRSSACASAMPRLSALQHITFECT
jgi:hypothetical protein